jgi:carbon monoxide dehydrogenase subunit G
MEFTNEFSVPVPIDRAWSVLMDVERIAPCFPGAKITDVLGPDRYTGMVNVRLGPMLFAFTGTAQIEDRDDRNRTAKVIANGSDNKGRGGAQAVVRFGLQAAGPETLVTVRTNLQLSGAVAQFGRNTGIISDVAAKLIRHFEQNLRAQLASEAATEPLAPQAGRPAGPGKEVAEQSISFAGLALGALWAALVRLVTKPFGTKRSKRL